MENTEWVILQVTIPKSKMRKIKAHLKKLGAVIIRETPSEVSSKEMKKGKFKKGEKPSDANDWLEDREETDFDEWRRKAWGGRGVH